MMTPDLFASLDQPTDTVTGVLRKMRTHFHDLMNQTHLALKEKSNLVNPLKVVAEELAERINILCLDEFVIIDIADAMIRA